MSSTQWLAKLTVDDSAAFYFAYAPTRDGTIIDLDEAVQQELRTNGVDGARWRDVHRQYRNIVMSSAEVASSDLELLDLHTRYAAAIGQYATLVYSYRSTIRTWKKVKIRGCDPAQMPGPLYGFGATVDGTVTSLATWSLRLTQPSTA